MLKKLFKSTRVKTWKEYCEKMEGKDSYYINNTRGEIMSSKFRAAPIVSEFDNKEDVEAFAAFSKLLKLRKEWIGDWQPDWKDGSEKYVICRYENNISTNTVLNAAYCLSFPTEEMRNEFLQCFKDYLEQAKNLI